MDVEIAAVLQKKPSVIPKETTNDVTKMKLRKIHRDNWSVAFQKSNRDGENVKKFLFSCLNYIVVITEKCKVNAAADKKCFTDMIKWYITV